MKFSDQIDYFQWITESRIRICWHIIRAILTNDLLISLPDSDKTFWKYFQCAYRNDGPVYLRFNGIMQTGVVLGKMLQWIILVEI